MAEAPEAAQPGLGEELRALALISLGSTEFWAARFEEAERHLEQGVALARRIGRPFLEFTGLVYAASEFFRSAALAAEHSRQAVELAEQHGWTDDASRRLGERRYVARRADVAGAAGGGRTLDPARRTDPQGRSRARSGTGIRSHAGCWSWRAAGTLTRWPPSRPPTSWPRASPNRAWWSCRTGHFWCKPWSASVRPSAPSRPWPHSPTRTATTGPCASAWPRCGSRRTTRTRQSPRSRRSWTAPHRYPGRPGWLRPFLLEAIARDALGDPGAAGRALEHALDLAEPDGVLIMVLAAPGAGPAPVARPAAHCPRRADRRDPQPAGRAQARPAAGRAAAAARAAERKRDPGAALPADQPVGAGDRRRAVRLAQHGQDPHHPPVRQARHAHPGRGRRPRRPSACWHPLRCTARPHVLADGRRERGTGSAAGTATVGARCDGTAGGPGRGRQTGGRRRTSSSSSPSASICASTP